MKAPDNNPNRAGKQDAASKGRANGPRGQKKKGKKELSPTARKVVRGLCAALCVLLILGCIGTIWLTIFVFDTMSGTEYEIDLDVTKLEYTTIVYAEDQETGGWTELNRLYNPDANRIWVDYDQMPKVLLDAVVAVEDKRFESHNGVDWQRTFLSGVNYVMKKVGLPGIYEGTPGASTITQQLVRNLTQDKEYGTARKMREIFRALKLEQRYSKDQILEAYLNTVPFSNETYGIQAAANFYFNKDVAELTAAECASIVGITKDPTNYNPHTNYENNQKRKEDILYLMFEQGKLTREEYDEALVQEVVFSTENNAKRIESEQSYFVDYVVETVVDDLVEQKGYTEAEARRALRTGGYRIYTTMDTRIQGILEEIYVNWEEYFPAVLNEEYPQSAFIISDINGKLVGMVGGKGEKEGALVWNRATDTARQIGSTIKPISSYALAFESDLIHFSTMIEDKAVVISPGPGQPDWTPRNYYAGYKGFMTVDEAVQRSTNMVPVQLTQMLTPRALWNFMHDSLNIDTLTDSDVAYSPMALGSLSIGVTPLKMLGAYQMFASGGTRTEPYCYTRVLDSTGAVVLENTPTPVRVISYETATVMNKLLQRVTTGPYGTGAAARLASGIPVGGKTGTTDDDVDQWFIGFTPYYVGVCWFGYDEPYKTATDESGNKVPVYDAYGNRVPNTIRYNNYPPPILWRTVMNKVHEGLPVKDFIYSSNVVSLEYCTLTGYAATDECESTAVGWYKPMNIPSPCPYHGDHYSTVLEVPTLYSKSETPESARDADDYDDDD